MTDHLNYHIEVLVHWLSTTGKSNLFTLFRLLHQASHHDSRACQLIFSVQGNRSAYA